MSRVGLFGQISEITDHLFLSGSSVLKPEKIQQKKITLVVNVTTEEPNAYLNGVDYVKIRVDDDPSARLNTYFDIVADKIKANKERGGRTLVHCVAGVSRSASLCMVYLVKYEHMTLRQAFYHVKAARSIIRPNVGFWKQMIDYEQRAFGRSSVKMVVSRDNTAAALPDVYGNELRRQFITTLVAPSSARASATPNRSLRLRPSSAALVDARRPPQAAFGRNSSVGASAAARRSTLLGGTSLAASPSRRPSSRQRDSLFDNLYHSTHELFFPTF